jgi:hypothetical protein
MTVNYTDADVRHGKLAVNTGGEDFTVNITIPVSLGIRNAGDGIINLGSGADILQDYSSGDLTINLGAGNDNFFVAPKVGTVHIDVTGGAGNDFLQSASANAIVNFNYFFGGGRSQDGSDGIKGFVLNQDTLTLHGVTETQFNQSFVVTDAPGSVGVVITDGTNDGWSVQLIGVHETKAELLADGAFVFA